jgi:hypothetical protein
VVSISCRDYSSCLEAGKLLPSGIYLLTARSSNFAAAGFSGVSLRFSVVNDIFEVRLLFSSSS